MKFKVLAVLVLSVVLFAGLASVAGAQSVCDTINFSTQTGAPGDTVDVDGVAEFGTLNILWDGTLIGTLDVDGSFTTSFMVPSNATPGTHTVTIENLWDGPDIECPFTFTVTGTVQQTAYAPAAVLPSTGFFLLVPAAGAALGGAALIVRKRRSSQG